MKLKILIFTLLSLAYCPVAFAEDTLSPGNTAWLLTSTALVLMMTIPGLSLFYAGLVRSKNVLSILMQCFTITCVVSVVWLFAGYSLAFDDLGNNFIGGLGKFLFAGVVEESMSGDVPESAFALFQATFAIIAVALIVGGFAERIKFSAVVVFAILWILLVYAPIAHWVWGGGWLGSLGVLDFAGGNVVHIAAGISALVGAFVLGNRKGFPSGSMMPHNMTLTMIGAGMLWVGWFGFNGGSAVAANQDAAMAMLVTHICAASAALSFVVTEYFFRKSATALAAATGMVAGLVAIT
ncbi:MAG: ammonium transporter, partial [Gammaproteobacteria bacterium]|nr:ammonium transporter [Gammaproteobacteria bacterium]